MNPLPPAQRSPRPRGRRGLARPSLVAWSAVAALALASVASAQGLRECAKVVVADAGADAPVGGAILDVDLELPPNQNTATAATGTNLTLSHVAVAPGRAVYATDLDADPGGLGPDPNGGPGRGAVLELDPGGGPLQVLSDGTGCDGSIVNCGVGGVFVDPVGLAWSLASGRLIVVDPDADPSGLGPDGNGFAGRGAVFAVDPMTGLVSLVADGTNYPAGLPSGRPSVFEDPVGVSVARDGTIWVVDQLAIAADDAPNGTIFRIDPLTGEVTALPAARDYTGLRDLAVEPGGTLLVLDRLAGRQGQLLRIDPASPVGAVLAVFAGPELVDPVGIVSAGNGEAWLLDAAADPFNVARSGAVYRLDAGLMAAGLVSSTDQYAFPWSLDLLESEVIDSLAPATAEQGELLTLSVRGGTFLATPTVDFGPGVNVEAVRWLSFSELEVDLRIDAAAPLGLRDVTITNPDVTMAFHCDLFEVTAAPGCAPTQPVGDSLRVTRPEPGRLRLAWQDEGLACVRSWKVFGAERCRPDAPPGDFPDDPDFEDLSLDDLTADPGDNRHERELGPASLQYFLIVPVGTDGSDGPSGHY